MHSKEKNNRNWSSGFTLIESVIAIVLIGVIGLIMADILGKTFDNSSKATALSTIQQNGQSALDSISETARYAQFVCIGDAVDVSKSPNQVGIDYTNPIFAVYKNGRYIRYIIYTEPAKNPAYIQEDFPTVNDATGASTATILCAPTNTSLYVPSSTATNQHVITDNTSLSVRTAALTLLSSPVTAAGGVSKVSVNLKFSLGARSTLKTQVGSNNQIDFSTTIQFR